MPRIAIETFSGEVPRTIPRLLKNTQASVAINCDLQRGAIEAMRGSAEITALPSASRRTIFKHDVDGWLSWANKVSVVKSAVLDLDGTKPLGHLLMTGEREYPTQYFAGGSIYRLGVPRPSVAPTVKLAEGADIEAIRAYAWGTNSNAFPPSYGDEQLAPIQTATATVTAFVDVEDEEPRIKRSSAYVYTLVQTLADGVWQQESAPSPASNVIDVPEGDGVVVSGFVIPKLEKSNITHIRIYRTASGDKTSEFQFVTELDVTTQEYTDTIADYDLSGDVLATLHWDAIPDDAQGLVKTDNGIYAAFRGNEILLSEPFVPYAFPEIYRNTVEDKIVALAHTDNTIVVLTEGRPYLVVGSAPESMQYVHVPIEQSCVSAESVATSAGSVLYASPDGIMRFSANGQELMTEAIWTREQWQELNPSSILATVHDNRYIAFFAGTNKGFILPLGSKEIIWIEFPNKWKIYSVYHHSRDDCVYFSVDTTNTRGYVHQFEAGDLLTYRWRSKPFFTSALTCMSAVRIEAEYDEQNEVTVNVYGKEQEQARCTLILNDSRTKRLTTTRSEKLWSIEVSGQIPVYEIRMANSVAELEHE